MIADDFTGALDAGVQFAKKGFSTKVLVYSKDMSFQAEDADVLVVDAETRHKKPLEAYLTIFRIVKPAAESGVKYLFKKTDSALRGNIGAELTAMLDATGKSLLVNQLFHICFCNRFKRVRAKYTSVNRNPLNIMNSIYRNSIYLRKS